MRQSFILKCGCSSKKLGNHFLQAESLGTTSSHPNMVSKLSSGSLRTGRNTWQNQKDRKGTETSSVIQASCVSGFQTCHIVNKALCCCLDPRNKKICHSLKRKSVYNLARCLFTSCLYFWLELTKPAENVTIWFCKCPIPSETRRGEQNNDIIANHKIDIICSAARQF